jgi:hypothetical protein
MLLSEKLLACAEYALENPDHLAIDVEEFLFKSDLDVFNEMENIFSSSFRDLNWPRLRGEEACIAFLLCREVNANA